MRPRFELHKFALKEVRKGRDRQEDEKKRR